MDSLTGMDSAVGRSGVEKKEAIGGRLEVDRGWIGDWVDRKSMRGRTEIDLAAAAAGAAYAIHREPPLFVCVSRLPP